MSKQETLRMALENMVSNIVQGDDFVVSAEPEDEKILLKVRAKKSELGKIIGKGGDMASSIRKVLRAMSKKQGVSIKFSIDNTPME
jgi:predicted RNA-binding protein YlqC (UPF0109 family)